MLLRDFAHDRETIDWLLDQGVDISQTDTRRLDDGFNLASEASDDSLHLLNKVAADGDIDLFDLHGQQRSRRFAKPGPAYCVQVPGSGEIQSHGSQPSGQAQHGHQR
jgi:hypothetical protein